MHSPALALNWQIWGRHRWGLAAAFAIVVGICVMAQSYAADRLTDNVPSTDMPLIGAVLMPLGFVMLYLAYVFSHAELGHRAGASGFPFWMMTLPVRTPWLVLWPMLSAAITVAVVWLAVCWFALNKIGLDVPLVWPAMGLACSLVWIQAVDWSPLGSISKALIAIAILVGLWKGLMRDDSRSVTFAATPAILLLGFVAGSAGVNHLRRGGQGTGFTFVPALRWRLGRERRFATPQQAQFWLECRRNGNLLPLLATGWGLLTALDMVFNNGDSMSAMIFTTPVIALIMAPVAGLILGKPDIWSRQVRLATFAAGRPITCGDMVLVKLRATALSLLTAWLIVGLVFAVWLSIGTHYAGFRQSQTPSQDSVKLYVMYPAVLIGFFGFHFFLVAGTFVVSLAGRFWMILAVLFFYFGALPNLMALDAFKFLKDYLIEAAAVALAFKLVLAGWAFRCCHRRRLISGRGIAGLVGAWLVTVACALLAFVLEHRANSGWAYPAEVYDRYLTEVRNAAIVLGLFCPLFRIALAPLALAWNRHR